MLMDYLSWITSFCMENEWCMILCMENEWCIILLKYWIHVMEYFCRRCLIDDPAVHSKLANQQAKVVGVPLGTTETTSRKWFDACKLLGLGLGSGATRISPYLCTKFTEATNCSNSIHIWSYCNQVSYRNISGYIPQYLTVRLSQVH